MNHPAPAATPRSAGTLPTDVYFFATCLVDQFAPEAGLDAIRLIEREGIRVHFPPDQTCCGQPAYTSGYLDQARAVARTQLDLFPEPWPIVVPSGSCAGMMGHHYVELFAEDPPLLAKATALATRVHELTNFLVNVVGFQRQDQGAACTVVLHTSCHARREIGSHIASHALLDGLAQVSIATQARPEECCGFGGTFALRHPTISGAMVEDKLKALVDTGASQLVSADCGCLMNILGHAAHSDLQAAKTQPSLPGEHIASFLWRRTAGGRS